MPPARERARPDWYDKFLQALAVSANVSRSARAAGKGRRTVYDARQADDAFALEWDEAIEEALDGIEIVVMQAAKSGEHLPVSQWVLAKRRSSVWGDRTKVELTGSVNFNRDADDELLDRLTRLAEVAQQADDAKEESV